MEQQDSSFQWSLLPLQFLVGIIVILFNAPGFVRYVAHNWVGNGIISDTLGSLANIPENTYLLFTPLDGDLFSLLLRLSIYGIGFYLLGVVTLAIGKQELRLIPSAIISLVTGVCAIAIMLWAFLILFWLVRNLILLVVFLLSYINILLIIILAIVGLLIIIVLWEEFGILGIIGLFLLVALSVGLGWLILPYLPLIITILLWIGGISVAIGLLGLVIALLAVIWDEFALPGIVAVLILGALVWFGRSILYDILLWVYERILLPLLEIILQVLYWLGGVLLIVIGFLFRLLVFLALVCMGIGIIALLGNILLDDLRAAWNAGSGLKGTVLASFGIGLAVGLLLLTSSGTPQAIDLVDQVWQATVPVADNFSPMNLFVGILPSAYQAPMQSTFAATGIPIFNALVVLTVLGISYLGIIRGLGREREDKFHVYFIGKEAATLAFAVPLAVLVVVILALAPSENA